MVDLIIVLILMLCNGFFAMSEMAVLTSRKSRLKQMAVSSWRAQKALDLAEHPESFLSAVQLWISLLGLLVGYFGGESLGEKIAVPISQIAVLAPYADRIGFAIGFLLMLFFFGLLGELVPKRIGTLRPEQIACAVAYPMHFFATIAKPLVVALSACTRWSMRLLGLGNATDSSITQEEIRLLVSEGHEQGLLDADERNMMNRVLRLGDRTADSLMTPRKKVVWLDTAATYEENMQVLRESEFSRFPVYRDNDSDIAGVLEVKSLLDRFDQQNPEIFRNLREPLFVSESTNAMKLLEILREEQQSMALVVDEYGELQGLVTLSDLMGAVVGRLQAAENSDEDALVVTRADGSLLVDGSLPNDDLSELLGGVSLPDDDEADYNTLAGLVIEHFGRIPQVGEYLDWAGWRIEVVDLDGARIDKLLLQKLMVSSDDHDTN